MRDSLLGVESGDFDIEIYDLNPGEFGRLMKKLGASGVGKSFFVYKLGKFDLSLPRTESKSGVGHKGFDVRPCNAENIAYRRRDFTINALMVDIFSGEMLDFCDGQGDLERGILRVVDEKTFGDDSLRVLRAAQFAARFALKIEPASAKIMQNIDISDLSRDRIKLELEKLFIAPHQDYGVRALSASGLDVKLFGVSLDAKFGSNLASHFDITHQKETFLYDLIHRYKLDAMALISRLGLGNEYKRLNSSIFVRRAGPKTLAKIAFDAPLRTWVGLNSKARLSLAKKLGIYDQKMPFKVDNTGVELLSLSEKLRQIQAQKAAFLDRFLKEKRGLR